MKRIKFILTTALSLLVATAWADTVGGNTSDVKNYAASLINTYADESNETPLTPTLYGDGANHAFSPKQIGWDCHTILATDKWKLHLTASRTGTDVNYAVAGQEIWGTPLLCSAGSATSNYSEGVFKFYQCASSTENSRCNGAFRFVTNKDNDILNADNANAATNTNGLNFDITVVYDGNGHFNVATIIDDKEQAKNIDYTIFDITEFSYCLPVNFNINSLSIVRLSQVTVVAPKDEGTIAMTVEGNGLTSPALIEKGKTVVVTATPTRGHVFKEWRDADGHKIEDAGPSYSFVVGETDVNLTAVFERVYIEPETATSFVSDKTTISNNNQYVSKLSYNGKEIYNASSAPDKVFQLIDGADKILDVLQGEDLVINWERPGKDDTGLMIYAFCDIDQDKRFEVPQEPMQITGTREISASLGVSGIITLPIPEDAPVGQTRARLRFDSAWAPGYNATLKYVPADTLTNRYVYDVIVNVIENTNPHLYVNHAPLKGSVTAVVAPGTSKEKTYTSYKSRRIAPEATVALTATPALGCTFKEWQNADGTKITDAATYTVTMTEENLTIKAVFEGYDVPESQEESLSLSDLNAAKTNHQYVETFKSDNSEEAFYTRSDADLNTHFHIVNTKESAIKVEQGKPLNIYWEIAAGNTPLMLSAFCDLDGDINFDCVKDYKKKELGTRNGTNFASSGTVTIPTKTAPLGFTRVRLRFDGSFHDSYDEGLGYFPPTASTNRHVYDIIVEVIPRTTAFLDLSCDEGMGTVWAEVTPSGETTSTRYDKFPQDIPFNSAVTLHAEVANDKADDYEFVKWTDRYGNRISGGSANPLTISNIGKEDVICKAVIEGIAGKHAINCTVLNAQGEEVAGPHQWNIHFKAMGTIGTIVRVAHNAREEFEANPSNGKYTPDPDDYCDGGCYVKIPSKVWDDKKTEPADEDKVTLEQVSTTIIHGEHTIKKLKLPESIDEIKRSRVLNLKGKGIDISPSAPLHNGSTITPSTTHAGHGAKKWPVTPEIKGDEEWWFVGVFDFPDKFDVSDKTSDALMTQYFSEKYPIESSTLIAERVKEGKVLRDHGCALLTSREWPSQAQDDWTGRFQIWVDGNNKGRGNIRLVNSKATADPKTADDYLYFIDTATKQPINVMGANKIVRFEVHNYPKTEGAGNIMIYTVQIYEKDNITGEMGKLLQEGTRTENVEGFHNINWVSNFAPEEVGCNTLKFFRPETSMLTYRDGVEEDLEFCPTKSETIDGKDVRTINLKNKLLTDEEWVMAVHYIPTFTDDDEIIVSTGDNFSEPVPETQGAGISEGFRIVQKKQDKKLYFQSSYEGAKKDTPFTGIELNPDYPITIIVYHYADGTLAVSATDRLNDKVERINADVKPDITKDISKIQTQCTYAANKFDVTVATMEHLLFANCPYLEFIEMENQDNYQIIDGAVYDKKGETLVLWPEGKVKPCKETGYHPSGVLESVEQSKYAGDEVEINLPESVRKIASLAFLNVRDENVRNVAVNVDYVNEIERLSYVNGAVTYVTTPKHFLEMERNDQIAFRLRLSQEEKDSINIDRIINEFNYGFELHDGASGTTSEPIEPRSYSQISMPDRFGSVTADKLNNWNTFTVPFTIKAKDVKEHFAKVYRLSDEGGVVRWIGNDRTLTVNFEKVYDAEDADKDGYVAPEDKTEMMLAGVPYLVKLNENTLTNHAKEVRFSYSPFCTVHNPINSIKSATKKAATDQTSDSKYDYYISMTGNFDPTPIHGTDHTTLFDGRYEYTYLLSNNKLVQVKKGGTSNSKGYRGCLKIYAVPKDPTAQNPAPALRMSMAMNEDNGQATGIIELAPDEATISQSKKNKVYSLSGMFLDDSLDNLPSGVYIINNQKVVKR